MKKITIYTSCPTASINSHEKVGVLFECALDSQFASQFKNSVSIDELIGDPEQARRLGSELATRMLMNEPHFRGIPQLSIFHEVICSLLHKAYHLIHLHDYLVNERYDICEFNSASWWGEELLKLTTLNNSSLQIKMPRPQIQSKFKRCLNRISKSKYSFNAIYSEFKNYLNQIDLFHKRSMWINYFSQNKFEKGKAWFYSTAVNYTKIGLSYESSFPEQLNFLVENKTTGGKPLRERKRKFTSFYHFASSKCIPDQNEINKSSYAIRQHMLHISLDQTESVARKWLIANDWLTTFFARLLPYGLFSSAVFENWINVIEPTVIIVGNQVFEGYALYKAKEKKIPTLLLQHGVLADYFPYSDHPVDHYIVRGQFFYERLSAASQKRAFIFNPPSHAVITSETKKNFLVFITTPSYMRSPSIEVDVESILLTLIKTAESAGIELIIRVHPLESMDEHKAVIRRLCAKTLSKLNVQFSQGGNVDQLFSKACAAVLFCSTMFLDCIKHGVPIISVDWYDFGFKKNIESHNVFYFAENLSDLGKLIKQAVAGELLTQAPNLNFLLDNSLGIDFKNYIKAIAVT